ncbi:MAG: hypothetical protein EOP87_05890 [Verrucomicrobiaceae bacterium]|nr:MAG: hypothetical protein EOP87_05890 [Verrucomicrobiaceae bacterium]
MAIHKSDIIRAKDSLDVSGKSLSGEKTGAQVLYATAEYVVGSPALALNDVIELADIPAGATVVPELSYVRKSFGDRDVKVSLGDKDANDRFGVVGTMGSGVPEGPHFFGYDGASQATFGYQRSENIPKYAETTRVKATINQLSTSVPAQEKLQFGIAYRVQG